VCFRLSCGSARASISANVMSRTVCRTAVQNSAAAPLRAVAQPLLRELFVRRRPNATRVTQGLPHVGNLGPKCKCAINCAICHRVCELLQDTANVQADVLSCSAVAIARPVAPTVCKTLVRNHTTPQTIRPSTTQHKQPNKDLDIAVPTSGFVSAAGPVPKLASYT